MARNVVHIGRHKETKDVTPVFAISSLLFFRVFDDKGQRANMGKSE